MYTPSGGTIPCVRLLCNILLFDGCTHRNTQICVVRWPVNRPPQTVQRVCFGTLGTGISHTVLKSIYKNKKKTIRESDLGVPPVPKLGNNKAKPDKESEKGVPPVPRGGGKPTLSPAGVLRIPMNTPIRYRYWLKGTSFEPAGVEILSLSEIRSSLFGKNIPAKTGN